MKPHCRAELFDLAHPLSVFGASSIAAHLHGELWTYRKPLTCLLSISVVDCWSMQVCIWGSCPHTFSSFLLSPFHAFVLSLSSRRQDQPLHSWDPARGDGRWSQMECILLFLHFPWYPHLPHQHTHLTKPPTCLSFCIPGCVFSLWGVYHEILNFLKEKPRVWTLRLV